MVLCKAMILVGALLLVSTCQTRIMQVNEPTPHEPEEMMKHACGRGVNETMKQMVEQDQEELAEALVEEDMYKGQTGKIVEHGAVKTGAVLTRRGLPRDRNDNLVVASAGSAREDAEEEADEMEELEPWAELVVKAEQAVASHKDLMRQRKDPKDKHAKGNKAKGKSDVKVMMELMNDLAMRRMAKQDQDELMPGAPQKWKVQRLKPQRWEAQIREIRAKDNARVKAEKVDVAQERAQKAAADKATAEKAAAKKRVAKETLKIRLQRRPQRQAAADKAGPVKIAAKNATIEAAAAETTKPVKEATEQAFEDVPTGEEKAGEQDADDAKEQQKDAA